MRIISVKQPWAWAIASGLKLVENRSWRTHYRGPLAIHASGRPERGIQIGQPDGLPCGAIVAITSIVDCVPFADVAGQPFAVGPWCWMLGPVQAIEPIPMLGRLSLFRPTSDVADRLARTMPRAP